jgi:hypothetical protein
VPIGFNTAAEVCAGPLESTARAVTALLPGRGVVIDERALALQVWILFVAYIAQEQSLLAVADEYKCAMRDFESVHRRSRPG